MHCCPGAQLLHPHVNWGRKKKQSRGQYQRVRWKRFPILDLTINIGRMKLNSFLTPNHIRRVKMSAWMVSSLFHSSEVFSEITLHALPLVQDVYLHSTHRHFLDVVVKSIIDVNVCVTCFFRDKKKKFLFDSKQPCSNFRFSQLI